MGKSSKSMAAALLATTLANPATALAQCWTAEAAEAAQVRDFETMLMVASLRCRITGNDFIAEYNGFVRENRSALTEANDRLRAHFAPEGGLNAYDSYVTSIANRYGAGAEGLTCNDMQSILAAARAEGRSLPGLIRLAKLAEVKPRLPGNRCEVDVAAVR